MKPRERNRPGFSARCNASTKKRFADIDVAKPRHHPLIKQGQFDGRTSIAQHLLQVVGMKQISKRFGSHLLKVSALLQCLSLSQVHKTEPTRVIVNELELVVRWGQEIDYHVIMFRRSTHLMMKVAWLDRCPACEANARWIVFVWLTNCEPAGHAEVDDQDLVSREEYPQIFAAPINGRHPGPG